MHRFTLTEFTAKNVTPGTLTSKDTRLNFLSIINALPYLFFLVLIQLSVTAQHRTLNSKIDPIFQYVLDHPEQPGAQPQENLQSPNQVQATEGFISKNTIPVKRHECIVYTKNAKVLQDNGILHYRTAFKPLPLQACSIGAIARRPPD